MTPRTGAVEPDRRSAHFLSLLTWTRDDLDRVWAAAEGKSGGEPLAAARRSFEGGTLGWIEEAPAPSHRNCLEAAAARLGARLVSRASGGEPERLAERVQGDRAVAYRAARHARLLHLARRSPAPVLAAGSPHGDPLRVFADLFTLHREGRDVDELTILWAGGPTPELTSWLEASTRYRFTLALALPPPARPDPALLAFVRTRTKGTLLEETGRDAWERADVLVAGEGDAVPVAAGAVAPPGAVHLGRNGRPPDTAVEADLAAALLVDLRRRWDAGGRGR